MADENCNCETYLCNCCKDKINNQFNKLSQENLNKLEKSEQRTVYKAITSLSNN